MEERRYNSENEEKIRSSSPLTTHAAVGTAVDVQGWVCAAPSTYLCTPSVGFILTTHYFSQYGVDPYRTKTVGTPYEEPLEPELEYTLFFYFTAPYD